MKMVLTDFDVAILEGDSHLSKWIVEQRRLDVADKYLHFFEKYIPTGGTVVDVGACLGDHTLTFSKMVGPKGEVFAFEPNPDAYRCLVHNVRELGNVTTFNWALGNRIGDGTLMPKETERDNVGAVSVKMDSKGEIPITCLNFFQFIRLDFLKIDAEGAEMRILIGAKKILRRFQPVLLIELNRPALLKFNTTPEKIRAFLKFHRYCVVPSEPHHSFDMDQLDALCIPFL